MANKQKSPEEEEKKSQIYEKLGILKNLEFLKVSIFNYHSKFWLKRTNLKKLKTFFIKLEILAKY